MKYAAALIAMVAGAASATPTSIFDGNSQADFDTASGQVNWLVDGVDQVFRQEFWFRRNGVDSRELRVDDTNLNLVGTFSTDTNPFTDNRNDAYGVLFNDGSGLEIEVLYTLRGGAASSGQSDLGEQITLRNLSNQAMTLSFFQYVDFDLGGDFGDDTVEILNSNTVRQSDDIFSVAETVVTPAASLFDVGEAFALRGLLTDSDIDDLGGNTFYQGDASWAFQWNITIAAGQSFLISKDKSITPAPGSLALLGLGGLAAARRRR